MSPYSGLRPALVVLLALGMPCSAAAGSFYLRAAAGWEQTSDTTVLDDDCTSTVQPALFGCGFGLDGRPLAARGDFGTTAVWELGLGVELTRRLRMELDLADRPGFYLDAQANFLGVAPDQPVTANGRSLAALVVLAVDLGPPTWRIQPYIAAGLGAALNETGDVLFEFPSIAPNAITLIQGGRHTDFAWSAALGGAFRWTASTHLELALRYTDLGELRTDAGEATIVRPSRTFVLDIAGTRADLASWGAVIAVRHRI